MSDRILHENVEALSRAGGTGLPSLAADSSADGEPEFDSGAVVGVSLRTARGLVRMHGRRDPVAEAERFLPPDRVDADLVVVIGAGAGFVLDALERRGGNGRVLVLEPSVASLKAALSRRSWTTLIDAGRLRILPGPDFAGWLDLRSWVGPVDEAPPVVVHPVLARERPAEVTRAADVVKRLLFNANANAAARKAFAEPYLLNTLSNLRHLVESRDVAELSGTFAGIPALVLAAGPSLNRNLEELRPHRDQALVLAVDTALRPCLAAGIEPDLVVAVDPGEANLRHLLVGAAPPRTHLVAEPSVAPGSFDAFAGRVFTFRVDRHHPWPWLQEQGIDRATLQAWGSVLTTTLDLAVKLGCNPIVLIGADFAYTGGQPYCRDTAYEEDWAIGVAAGLALEDVWRQWMRQPIVAERGIDGRDVETSAHLQAFRDWVVEFCGKHPDVDIVNGTGAGILRLRGAGASWTPRAEGVGAFAAIPRASKAHATRRAARGRARGMANLGRRSLRADDGAVTDHEAHSLLRGATAAAVPPSSLRLALSVSIGTPMIKRLPGVSIAQHPQEFEQLLQWIDELSEVRVLVEIGSRFGGSFYALAAHVGPPLTAIAVDLPGGPWGQAGSERLLRRVADQLEEEGIDTHLVLGDSRSAEAVGHVHRILAGRAIDVLFVDGDRSLAGVAGDLQQYAPLVRPGGLVAVHDVGWPYGQDGALDPLAGLQTSGTLSDVSAAFQGLARGRRSSTVTWKWGTGAVWM